MVHARKYTRKKEGKEKRKEGKEGDLFFFFLRRRICPLPHVTSFASASTAAASSPYYVQIYLLLLSSSLPRPLLDLDDVSSSFRIKHTVEYGHLT